MAVSETVPFRYVWGRIVRYVTRTEVVCGVRADARIDAEVSYIAGNEELVVDGGERGVIDRRELRCAWETLRDEGRLSYADAAETLGAARASVALAVLSEALDLRYDDGSAAVSLLEA